jgi:hypothetical protein
MKQCPRSGLKFPDTHSVCSLCGDKLVPETALPDADFVRVQRIVRRLRWLAAGQAVLVLHALACIAVITSLAIDSRWECWLIIPVPVFEMVVLFQWERWVVAESPNVRICDDGPAVRSIGD